MTKALGLAGALIATCALALAACGGSGAPPAPTRVSASDLNQTGAFWQRLTPDLKDELVSAGKERLGQERPDGAAQIRAVDTAQLEREIDRQFTNTAKRTQTIYSTYRGASDDLARVRLDDALSQMDLPDDETEETP